MKVLRKTASKWLWIAILLPLLGPSSAQGQPPRKAIVLGWDGAVPAFVADLLRRNKLPNLAKLIQGGAFADDVISVFPSTTAPAFTSLWTGAPPRVTGISGNRVAPTPRNHFTILDTISGFGSAPLHAEPLWISADRAGKHAVTTHGPFIGHRSDRTIQFQGYGGIVGRDGVITSETVRPQPAINWLNIPQSVIQPLEISVALAKVKLWGLLLDDPTDPQQGYDTLLITETKDGTDIKARLKAAVPKADKLELWSGAIEINSPGQQTLGTYLRLFDLKPDGSDFLLYFTRPTRELTSHPQLTSGSRAQAGAFIGNGASELYKRGAFGTTIPNGGEGLAEIRYLETVMFVQRQLMATSLWAMINLPWDLFFAYTPFPDEAEHLWRGYLDATLPHFKKDIADQIRPFLEGVYQTCDEFLGLLMARRLENTIVALVSDHGMEGVHKLVAINRVLERAGLLVTHGNGRVDVTKTKVFYPFVNDGYLLINTTDRKNGIVRPEERNQLISHVRQLLLAIRDGDRQVVTAVYDSTSNDDLTGLGGPSGGDVYLDILPGYGFDPRTGTGAVIAEHEPLGKHGFNPLRPSMRTLMVLNGPGIAAGQKLRDVRVIDFAPTLAALLGISGPKNTTGKVIEKIILPLH